MSAPVVFDAVRSVRSPKDGSRVARFFQKGLLFGRLGSLRAHASSIDGSELDSPLCTLSSLPSLGSVSVYLLARPSPTIIFGPLRLVYTHRYQTGLHDSEPPNSSPNLIPLSLASKRPRVESERERGRCE